MFLQHGICSSGTNITNMASGNHGCQEVADRYGKGSLNNFFSLLIITSN